MIVRMAKVMKIVFGGADWVARRNTTTAMRAVIAQR
jgi:hypothetical protein